MTSSGLRCQAHPLLPSLLWGSRSPGILPALQTKHWCAFWPWGFAHAVPSSWKTFLSLFTWKTPAHHPLSRAHVTSLGNLPDALLRPVLVIAFLVLRTSPLEQVLQVIIIYVGGYWVPSVSPRLAQGETQHLFCLPWYPWHLTQDPARSRCSLNGHLMTNAYCLTHCCSHLPLTSLLCLCGI